MVRLPDALAAAFHDDRFVGPPKGLPAGVRTRVGEARHPACGDHVVVWVASREGRVVSAGFKAVGCPAALATASAACSVASGLPDGAALEGALTSALEASFGPPAPAHRHAVGLVGRAFAGAMGAEGAVPDLPP